MSLRTIALSAASLGLAMPAAAEALLDLEVCNRSSDDAFVAVSYQPVGSSDSDWRNEGWYSVRAGECQIIAETDNAYFYMYAEVDGDSSRYWGGDHSECVEHPGPFGFWTRDGEACESHQDVAEFVAMHADQPGRYTWNLDP
ncbi:DUF1036 domain-containing protein [Albidovulum sediminis]|uniref:DUF1036 domain-containing protein n=1 Tax=Albidovulum sediminis TaxID=3066345 RepID=A0ABT2NJR3_9RHOB|nr:DUF1036 domain-containing protein [Defluviimonas sediminis]MCT8329166.1 DUF1036 domain-containing protein [Defluviimonas sediminis]